MRAYLLEVRRSVCWGCVGGMVMVKQKGRRPTAKQIASKGKFTVGEKTEPIPAAVWGQLEPLDRVAREMTERWGDTLPSLVTPDLAGKFEAAYEALKEAIVERDVVRTNKIATQLMAGWKRMEAEAEGAGHKPLSPHAWCVEMDGGQIVCFARQGCAELRKRYPQWVVYSFEDAACVLKQHFSEAFLQKAFEAFPNAKVTRVVDGHGNDNIEDDIPW